jgi:Ca2+-binding RTX toxin-like protein
MTSKTLLIMPMGDSITQGTVPGGYRLPLYNLLQGSGYNFDFVGNKAQSGDPTPDTNHWGQGGWQISATPSTIDGRSYVSIQGENRLGLYSEMSNAISTTYFSTDTSTTRNIILLQIGINDVLHQVVDSSRGRFNSDTNNDGQGEGQEWVAEGNIVRLQALLRLIDSLASSRNLQIEVVLGTIGPLTTAWRGDAVSSVLINEVLQYNSLINTMIPSMVFSNISVKVVDQYRAMLGRLADGVHPNSAGYAAMAQVWFDAIGGSTTNLQAEPRIAALANGRFVSAWTDSTGMGADANGSAVRAQLFNADGTRAGSEFLVNTTTAGNQANPSVTALPDGRFVIAWTDDSRSGNDRSGSAIRAQLFNANGTRAGAELLVNSTTAGNQSNPSITALAGGRFAIAWTDDSRSGNDRSGTAIRAQLFNANSSRAGSEFLVNTNTVGSQYQPTITTLADGRLAVGWTDGNVIGRDPSKRAVQTRIFDPRTAGVNLAGTANGDDLIGTRFNDTLRGFAGDDHLRGGAGNDTLNGGEGNDTLVGGPGADILTGEGGIDRFVLSDAASADVITDFASGTDKLVISQAGLRIGNGNTRIDGALLRSAPGGFSTAAELVIFTTNIASATITTANAAATIGRATAAYAVGATRLFAVDNGVRSHLYRFRAADANAIVAATELTLLADLRATPALALADFQFAL